MFSIFHHKEGRGQTPFGQLPAEPLHLQNIRIDFERWVRGNFDLVQHLAYSRAVLTVRSPHSAVQQEGSFDMLDSDNVSVWTPNFVHNIIGAITESCAYQSFLGDILGKLSQAGRRSDPKKVEQWHRWSRSLGRFA